MNIDLRCMFVSPDDSDDDTFEEFLDLVLDELERIGRDDVDLSASLSNRVATFTVFGDGSEPEIDKFFADVRTALHAANCATPGWETATLQIEAQTKIDDNRLVDA